MGSRFPHEHWPASKEMGAGVGGAGLLIYQSQGLNLTNMVTLYNDHVKTVNVSDLKAHLSAHIQFVRDGEEVLVCDRNEPVARIVPCSLRDRSEQERRLAARGVLSPPLKKRPASVSWPEPPGNVSDKVMQRIWREEREGR